MIQDIKPSILKNTFANLEIKKEDYLLAFDKQGRILSLDSKEKLDFPNARLFFAHKYIYLFSVDESRFFLSFEEELSLEGYSYRSLRELRDNYSGKLVYAAFTAYHLWKWYSDNVYCGKCGCQLTFGDKERSLVCPQCQKTIYPRLNPAVIVGVINGDSLLLTKYNRGYAHNALVAGFTEIGETLEETVSREVMEETGLRVKNIRYYKSQPWGIAEDILVGFYCEVDGDTTIKLDDNELKYAAFVKREDIELQPNNLSLTNEMMQMFKEGKITC